MFEDLLYTPTQKKYRDNQWNQNKGRSLTFSQLNKSHSGYKSTEIGSHSPYHSGTVSRLEEAKQTIDSVIVDIREQSEMNKSAFRDVATINNDVIEEFRRNYIYDKENVSAFAPETKSHYGSFNYQVPSTHDESSMLKARMR